MDIACDRSPQDEHNKHLKIAPRYNLAVEAFRDNEYPMLKGKTYLDHAGTTLYARSLIETVGQDLVATLYGNPHSQSTPSALSSAVIDVVRRRALSFFNADPDHFDMIFVPNATAAVKLVMDSFRDLASASTSSKHGHGQFCDEEVESWLDGHEVEGQTPSSLTGRRLGLFAYPGQSNMTGRRLPQSWPRQLRESQHGDYTYSLLDAAALATTTPIDLSDIDTAPDFMALSFYKIFGFPDLGGLIVRKDSGHVLQWRRYFGGGTVDMVLCIEEAWHARKDYTTDDHYSLHDQLEDGTLPFHSIFALGSALDVHARLFGSMSQVSAHTSFLAELLYDGLLSLKYPNGRSVSVIYKDASATYGDSMTQGATLAFNVQRADGSLIPYTEVEKLADERHIYVRSGGLCNPGGIATYLKLEPWEMKRAYSAGHRCGHATDIVSGKPTGVVRVSLGAMSVIADVNVFLNFMKDCFNRDGTYDGESVAGDEGVRLPLPESAEQQHGKMSARISTPSSSFFADTAAFTIMEEHKKSETSNGGKHSVRSRKFFVNILAKSMKPKKAWAELLGQGEVHVI